MQKTTTTEVKERHEMSNITNKQTRENKWNPNKKY